MGNISDALADFFTKVVETVAEHPTESAAVVLVAASYWGGYGKGYCDGRREGDEIYAGQRQVQGYLTNPTR